MSNLKQLIRSSSAFLLVLGITMSMSLAPVSAATRPVTVRPTMTLHYVYNCMNPTVEADFSNISGLKDIYAQSDAGVWLVAQNFNFNASTVYDGYWHLPGVMQAELFVTNPGVGPFGDRVVGKSTAATALCPTYDPVYDAHMVAPTPPAGSVPIEFLHIQWYANN